MTKKPLFEALASAIGARLNCIKMGNKEWIGRHEDRISAYEAELPSGSGFDSGTKVDLDRSTGEKLVLTTSFHHMDEAGSYDGWTEHTVTVTASLVFRISFKISGRDRNEIKDYIHEYFHAALTCEVEE